MKKQLLLLFAFSILIATEMLAQKVTIKLVNGASLKPIEGASIRSYLDKNLHLTSDIFGHITIQLKENDTLIITKDYYHPLYLFVKVKNFDTTHVLSVNMVPSQEIHEPIKGNFNNLTDFEYHFVHDQLGNDSHVKVQGFEHQTASQVRTDMMHTKKDPNGFHITPVRHHQTMGDNQYKLKE